jgi:diguanylate cyclase (GGDEF)-like protein
MAIARAQPIQKSVRWWPFSNPINSVGRSLVAGFAALVIILVAVVVGSSWMVREHQNNLADMEHHTAVADLLQDTQTKSGTTATFLFGYLTTGNELLLPTLQEGLDSSRNTLDEVVALEDDLGHSHVADLKQIQQELTELHAGTATMISLMQSGQQEEALLMIQATAPPYNQWVLKITNAIRSQQHQVTALRNRANRAGDLALLLLVVSGIAGAALAVFVSFLIARSIIRPLSSLEATAREVAKGGLDARAAATGPRELAHLGDTMNYMMDTIQAHTEEIEERGRQLLDARAQAASDPLTGLGNHRRFHEKIRDMVAAAQTNGAPVGLIMLDVDNFKGVNDTLGHQAGDQVLRDLSATIAEIASQEQAFRYGGDEFTILLPDCDQHKTAEIAENLLHAVEKLAISGGQVEQITISAGVATFPDMAESVHEFIYRADMALNWAKSAGKNRLGVWDSVFGSNQDGDTPDAAGRAGTASPSAGRGN